MGSNLGPRRRLLADAVAALDDTGDVVAVSSLYETAPIGGPEQAPYLNAVAVVASELEPRALLDRLLVIEAAAGRTRRERWEARTLDLDLLLHGDLVVAEPGLTVPHPRLTVRRFALEPLLEVRPAAALPDGTALAGFLPAVADQVATVVADPNWWRTGEER